MYFDRQAESSAVLTPPPHALTTETRGGRTPLSDAVAAGLVVLAVSAAGVAVTYDAARRWQFEATQNELVQTARIAATRIDADLHASLDSREQELGPEYRRAVAPLVRVQQASDDVIYVYTAVLRDGRIRYVLDSAAVYRIPGDTEEHSHLMEEYRGTDVEFRRALETRSVTVNARPQREEVRTYLSAYAPFWDSRGQFAGVVGVDMWIRALDARMSRLRRIALAASASIVVVAFLVGLAVFRLRSHAVAAEVRDRAAIAALAEARAAAEQASRAKSAFLEIMSHELRTPLSTVVGYSELMHEELGGRDEPSLSADVSRVREAGHHLAAVISDILDFSTMESGHVEFAPVPVDFATLLDELVTLFHRPAAAKGLTLRLDLSRAGTTTGVADPVRFRQILFNLIGNAVKFTDRGGVTVRLRSAPLDGARLVCTVHDTGMGIPADKRALLFQPFSQVDASLTRSAGGTGLGLVISRRLVEAMGGTLEVRSREGRGSTFRLSVPGILGCPGAGEAAA
ncbi:MAG: ATP-binding protein [Vicinamibacterales bacterium]